MRRRISAIVVLSCLLPTANAFAVNVALSLYGASNNPGETLGQVFTNACMKSSGWDVYAVSSDNSAAARTDPGAKTAAPTDPVDDHLKTLLDSKHLNNYPTGTSALEAIKSSVAQASQSLRRGDQFYLAIAAHGAANCMAQSNQRIEKGIADYGSCDHEFSVRLPGTGGETTIKTADLVPILKSLEARGVRVAVDVRSCFSGAAIKDFARAGICAHAFSTPDTELVGLAGCTKEDPPYKGSMDTTAGLFCKSPDAATWASGNPNLFSKDTDVSSCFSSAVETSVQARKNLHGDTSLSSLYDHLRNVDDTSNQSMSSDGPYWVIGSMGFLGEAASYTGAQKGLPCITTSRDFIDALASNIDEIGASIVPEGCPLKEVVQRILEPDRAKLDGFYDKIKKLASIANEQQDLLARFVPGGAEKLDETSAEFARRVVQRMAAIAAKSGQSWSKEEIQMRQKKVLDNFQHLILMEIAMMKDPKKLSPDLEDLISLTHVTPESIAEIHDRLSTMATQQRSAKADINQAVWGGEINRIERNLYEQLKKSKEFQACQNANPQLRASKKACDDFHL